MSKCDADWSLAHSRVYTARHLRPVFDPESVAVVGASTDPRKWGHWIARGVLRGKKRRPVYLVNRSGEPILGQRVYRSLQDLPEPVELVIMAVPSAAVGEALDATLDAGVRALLVISAGFAEVGGDGPGRQRELVARMREAGVVLIGPNCLGVVDTTSDFHAAWLAGDGPVPRGPIGLISQSGYLAYDAMLLSGDVGLGISRFASLGNQADITAADVIHSYIEHEATKVIAVYAEDFRDGRGFLEAAEMARDAGKAVIVLAAGASDASARAAQSHTGSMTSDSAVVDAACAAVGAVRVRTPAEMIDIAQVALRSARLRGKRLGIVSDGGGHGVVAADAASVAGFDIPIFSDQLRQRLLETTDRTAGVSNPVDLASSNVDPESFERVIRELAASGEVDAILMSGGFGSWDGDNTELAEQELNSGQRIAQTVKAAGVGLLVHTMMPGSRAATAMREVGAPIFRNVDSAVSSASLLLNTQPTGIPPCVDELPPGDERGYFGARALLNAAGVPLPPAIEVLTVDEAVAAGERLTYPVVLKAAELLHKSDAGGVALGISSADELRIEFERMCGAVSPGPFSVERMITEAGVELVVGCRRNERFGAVLMLGIGGIYTEILGDVAFALAPVSPEQAELLIGQLRGASLLTGSRGRKALAIAAAASTAARLSRLAASRPDIAEIEINPLLVHRDGAIALDARVLLAGASSAG
jgi:acetate---CoA ligase (ADP-forming)